MAIDIVEPVQNQNCHANEFLDLVVNSSIFDQATKFRSSTIPKMFHSPHYISTTSNGVFASDRTYTKIRETSSYIIHKGADWSSGTHAIITLRLYTKSSSPSLVGNEYNLGNDYFRDFFPVGNSYVFIQDEGFQKADISNPSNIRRLYTSEAISGNSNIIFYLNGYVYYFQSAYSRIDIFKDGETTKRTSTGSGSSVYDYHIYLNRWIYLATANNIQIRDSNSPESIPTVSSIQANDPKGGFRSVYVKNNIAYITHQSKDENDNDIAYLHSYDVSDPLNPTKLNSLLLVGKYANNFGTQIKPSGNYIYVVGSNFIHVFDIQSEPESPSYYAVYEHDSSITDLIVSGNLFYISRNNYGFESISFSVNTEQMNLYGICEYGDYDIGYTGCDTEANCKENIFQINVQCKVPLNCANQTGSPNFDCSKCLCTDGWYGNQCEVTDCFNFTNFDENACSQKGSCIAPQTCQCQEGYLGDQCETWKCNGFFYDDINSTCGGNGECLSPDFCKCRSFSDHEREYWMFDTFCTPFCLRGKVEMFGTCFESTLIYSIVGGATFAFAVVIFIIILIIIIIFLLCKRANRFNHIKNAELILKEAELEQKENLGKPQINFSKSKVYIDYADIELKEVIGEGGSNSTVFKGIWKGEIIAYKGFNCNKLTGTPTPGFDDENPYEEFEREVSICVNLNHPSILQFFGACMSPPKIGLVLEYCEKGDLFAFLGKNPQYSEKLRLLTEIVNGLEYLHSKNIIHRDLKPENILVNRMDKIKIMDFGLSKTKSNTNQTMTKMIGTPIYISPEVIKGGKYGNSCDVYSFAILVVVIITENANPYGELGNNEMLILNSVMKNPNFRPEINNELFKKANCEELIPIVKKCWSFDPKERYTFKELKEKFAKIKNKPKKSSGNPKRHSKVPPKIPGKKKR